MDNFEYDYEFLKEARLAKNISIEQIAFDLCLAERQIRSIENNVLDYFYSPAIKLVCVKKYAKKLDLDIDIVLYKLKREEVHKTDETVLSNESIIIHQTVSNPQQDLNSSNQSSHMLIELPVEYIEKNLSNKISMSDLTKHTGYSERSLQLIYQKYLKQTPFEYIENQRLLKARKLIEQHKQSKKITEVAQEVGLLHLGRFSVNFKKRFGISPSALAKV